jgi:hypothetical protein
MKSRVFEEWILKMKGWDLCKIAFQIIKVVPVVLISLLFFLLQGKHELLPYLLQKAEGGGGTSLPSLPEGGLVLHPLQEPRPVHLPQVLGGGAAFPANKGGRRWGWGS